VRMHYCSLNYWDKEGYFLISHWTLHFSKALKGELSGEGSRFRKKEQLLHRERIYTFRENLSTGGGIGRHSGKRKRSSTNAKEKYSVDRGGRGGGREALKKNLPSTLGEGVGACGKIENC